MVSQTDGAGNSTTYGYDALDRVTWSKDPKLRTTSFGYDAGGNRTTVTNAASDVTTYRYDAANHLVGTDYSSAGTPDVSYTLDASGRRVAMTDGTGTTTYAWDSLGRLVSSTNGAGRTVGYGWDLAGNLTSLAYPGTGRTVTRGFDDAGRMTSVTDWLSNTTTFDYDADGNLTSQAYANGAMGSLTYDAAGRLMAVDHAKGGTSFASFDYGRDAAGLLTATISTGVGPASEDYAYDDLDHLTGVDADAYGYDAADNPTSLPGGITQVFDDANQLCWAGASSGSCVSPPTGATTFTYDSRGNRTAKTPASGPATSYAFDQANLLTAVGGAAYTYNGDGLRTTKTVSSVTSAFTWDTSTGLALLLEDDADAYLYGPGGRVLERISGSTVTFFHADQLGSTRALTDDTGDVVGTFTYDAYGNTTGHTGWTTPLQFAGEYRDAESGLTYLRARYYDPTSGQFLNRDPLTAVSGSPYGYVDNNPVNSTDPLGLLCLSAHCLISDVKAGVRKAINSGALTGGIGPDQLGFLYGEVTSGFNCHERGDRLECRGAASPINGAPFTVGDVIMNPDRRPLSDDLFAHEARHSNQWAAFGGLPFVGAYGLDRLLEGQCNSFERSAGFARGGYGNCIHPSSSASLAACSPEGGDAWADRRYA